MNNIINMMTNQSETDLCNKNIGPNEAVEIAKYLSTNNCLHTLNLYGNNIETKGAVEIAKCLSTNNCLHTLYLNGNIGAKEVVEITKILESNYALTNIGLGFTNNKITEIINRNKDIFENRRFKKTKRDII